MEVLPAIYKKLRDELTKLAFEFICLNVDVSGTSE
jgi:hypothetical protein